MTTDTGSGYATQVPFGCATPRPTATGTLVAWRAVGARADAVDISPWRAVGARTDVVDIGAYSLNARFGLAQVRVAIGIPVVGSSTVPAAVTYIMRATDAAGNQFVYWETDDPGATPTSTYPTAVGALTDIRIFHEF